MTPKQIANENLANTIIKNMEKRRMEGYYCHTKEEAVKKVLELIPEGASIGWGGSVTLSETGVMDALNQGNYRMIDRMAGKTPEEVKKINAEIFCSDYFLMSSNAVTIDGELVNIDGNANRVACLMHGPEHVLIIVGMNKIVEDVDSGIQRVGYAAAPANAARLHTKTPCAALGHCGDCHSDDCMCCQIVITRHSRHKGRIKVILVGEELGF